MKNGKQIGDRFELRVAKILSAWMLGCGVDELPSASLLPVQRLSTYARPDWGVFAGKGDLLANRSVRFPWTVECKKRQDYDLWSFLAAPDDTALLAAWRQAESQCLADSENDSGPMLIFTKNNKPVMVMLQEESNQWLRKRGKTRIELPGAEGSVVLLPLSAMVAVPYPFPAGRRRKSAKERHTRQAS